MPEITLPTEPFEKCESTDEVALLTAIYMASQAGPCESSHFHNYHANRTTLPVVADFPNGRVVPPRDRTRQNRPMGADPGGSSRANSSPPDAMKDAPFCYHYCIEYEAADGISDTMAGIFTSTTMIERPGAYEAACQQVMDSIPEVKSSGKRRLVSLSLIGFPMPVNFTTPKPQVDGLS